MVVLRQCSGCKAVKSLCDFYRSSVGDGLQRWCKECSKASVRVWCRTNGKIWRAGRIDKNRKSCREYYTKNSERLRARSLERYYENAEAKRAQSRRWWWDHKDRARASARGWRAANPLRVQQLRANRRALESGAVGCFSSEDVRRIYVDQNRMCFYCGVLLEDRFQIDHKVPLCRGGTNWPSNLCCACRSCNLRKHDLTAEEFLERLRLEREQAS